MCIYLLTMQYTEGFQMLLPKKLLKILLLSNIWGLISLELETMDCGHTMPSPGRGSGVAMNATFLNNPARQHVSYCPLQKEGQNCGNCMTALLRCCINSSCLPHQYHPGDTEDIFIISFYLLYNAGLIVRSSDECGENFIKVEQL